MSGVLWYGHILGKNTGDVLRRTLDFEVAGRRGREQPNITWKNKLKNISIRLNKKRKMPSTERRGLMVFTNF